MKNYEDLVNEVNELDAIVTYLKYLRDKEYMGYVDLGMNNIICSNFVILHYRLTFLEHYII